MTTMRGEVLPVGPPVALEWQIGRTREIERVRRAAGNGEDIVLIDVRRTGKTTVALGAMEQLASAGHLVFVLDAMEASANTAELAVKLQRQLVGYRSTSGRLLQGVSGSVRHLAGLGVGATAFIEDPAVRRAVTEALSELSRDQRTGVAAFDAALKAIEHEAARLGRRATVLIDEVQAIVEWGDGQDLESLLRTRLAARPSNAPSFIFAGSEPTAMDTLFADGGMLKYHGLVLRMRPIAEEAWRQGLQRAFRELGCTVTDDALDELLLESKGHPLRTMLIAREAHETAETDGRTKAITKGHVVVAAHEARNQPLWGIDEETS